MNYGIVIKVLGNLLRLEAVGMVPALLISIYYKGDDTKAFIYSILITLVSGYLLSRVKANSKKIKVKEGLTIVSLGWLFVSFFGALPFILSGSIPSFVDAFFETVSGFTTTGSTIINDIEVLPNGILFWRSFSHWIGGMGILVFTVAILPAMGVGGFQIFKAESPGPIADKIVPRVKDTAKLLYVTYLGITFLEIILLKIGGLSLFESALHTFGTVGTGGFSTRNASIGAFDSSFIIFVISIFMLLSGTSFSLYYEAYKGRWKSIFKNQEFRLYVGIVSVSVLLITISLYTTDIYTNIVDSFKHSLFQVSSIITTTGYATADFDQWTTFSKSILFILMFIGGSAGSTGGGIKVVRILVLIKLIRKEFSKLLHPRAVIPIKIGDRSISIDTVSNIVCFFFLYFLTFGIGTILISLEGISLISASSAVVAALSNIGPGFDFVGPTRTFAEFSNFSKLILSFFMLLGRLELFTVLLLFSPSFWRDNR